MPAMVKKRKALAVRGEPEDDGDGERADGDFERDELGGDMEHFFGQEADEGRENAEDFLPITADGRLRLRPEIVLDGRKYAGRKSSRKRALEESASEEGQGDSDSEIANGRRPIPSDNDTSEEVDGLGWQAGDTNDDALEALSKEYEELREQEEVILRNLKTEGTSDAQKGRAVRNQKALWDQGLELRICLQKLLAGANRLPRGQAKTIFSRDARIKNSFEALTQAALCTLGSLLDLQQAIMKQNPAIAEAFSRSQAENGTQETLVTAEAARSISSVDEAWDQMTALYSSLVPYQNSSLDRWQRKTQLSTGAAASKLKLRAFNQSIAEQVGAIMRDPSRIVNRMRSRRSAVHVLGQARASDQADGDTTSPEEVDVDPESFDDSEFYQQLLQEFLDSEFYQQLLQEFLESSANGIGDMSSYTIRKIRNKKRKVVDRRASKGRKIRYNVFDPLINFCSPEPMTLPPMAEKLFGNLFGQTKRDKS